MKEKSECKQYRCIVCAQPDWLDTADACTVLSIDVRHHFDIEYTYIKFKTVDETHTDTTQAIGLQSVGK